MTNSFQIWIRRGVGAPEEITFTYGPIGGPDSIGLTVEAENRAGTSGVNLGSTPAEGDQYEILTSPPTPGGSVTIGYDARGVVAGTYPLSAAATSNVTTGTTIKEVNITVE